MLLSVPTGVAAAAALRRGAKAGDDVDELDRHHQRDQQPLRQIFDKALPQPGEIHVEQHDDEQEQHRDRADIDDDQDHRQELRAHQQEQAGRADEGKNEEEDRMDRVPGEDDGESRRHQNWRENPEEQSIGLHRPPLVISPSPQRPLPYRKAKRSARSAALFGAPVAARTRVRPAKRRSPATPVFRRAWSASFSSRRKKVDYRYGASSAMLRANSRSQRSPLASNRCLS